MSTRIDYNERLAARVPEAFTRLVAMAADQNLISPSAYVRQAIREKLSRDGFMAQPAASAAAPARRRA